jgi:hypothetical protein
MTQFIFDRNQYEILFSPLCKNKDVNFLFCPLTDAPAGIKDINAPI